MKTIIGLAGQPNAGKGVTAEQLCQLLSPGPTEMFEFSGPINAALTALGVPAERQNQTDLSKWARERFGHDLIARRIRALAEASTTRYVIAIGMRKMAVDLPMIRSFGHNIVVYVTAPLELRYAWGGKRGRPGEAEKTLAQFRLEDGLETEQEIRDIGAQADFTIANDREDPTFSHIRRQLLDGICKALPAPGAVR